MAKGTKTEVEYSRRTNVAAVAFMILVIVALVLLIATVVQHSRTGFESAEPLAFAAAAAAVLALIAVFVGRRFMAIDDENFKQVKGVAGGLQSPPVLPPLDGAG